MRFASRGAINRAPTPAPAPSRLRRLNCNYNLKEVQMLAHKVETTLSENGILNLQALPFTKGDRVEVIILKQEQESRKGHKRTIGEYSGKIKISDDFCEPLPDEFWLDGGKS